MGNGTSRAEIARIAADHGISLTAAKQRYYRGKRRSSDQGGVYFALIPVLGAVKIGWANDVPVRMAALQTACPEVLELLCVFRDEPRAEQALHHRFRADWIRGEWFRYSPAIKAFIARPPVPVGAFARRPWVRHDPAELRLLALQRGISVDSVRQSLSRRRRRARRKAEREFLDW
jgi:hypothetical protein